MSSFCEEWCSKLKKAGVKAVDAFAEKIRNQKSPENLESLICEARVALMFRSAGFTVTMQDRPDLVLELAGSRVYVEVKHFRMKEQDKTDESELLKPLESDLSVLGRYGDTTKTEGKPAWQQIVDVARKKIGQYGTDAPNILVIFSSSPHCVGDAEMISAAHELDDEVADCRTPGLERLSGLMLIAESWIKRSGRSVYFELIRNSALPLPTLIIEALSKIKRCVEV